MEPKRINYSLALRFWTYLGLVAPFFFPISPFWNESVYPVPVPPLYFKAYNLCDFFKKLFREFPGGLVVRILGIHCCGLGSIPGQGTEIPEAT